MKPNGGFALPRLAAPAQMEVVDYGVFRKSMEEKFKLYGMKKQNKEDRDREFGFGNKQLNITQRQLIKKVVLAF